MSVPVDVTDLASHVRDRGPLAYLLTVSDDGRPHAVSVRVASDGATFECGAGNRTAANATDRPLVSLLWPARDADDYSLIVDADAQLANVDGEARIRLTPTRAVLHRTVATSPGMASANDCVPLDAPTRASQPG